MSIDWITVIAQLINFLVLIWLLRRFLYRPILDGIDAREAQIAKRIQDADAAHQQALEDQKRYQSLYHKVSEERDQAISDALTSTRKERDQLMAQARKAIESEQQQWRSQMDAERQDFLQRLHKASALTLSEMTRKVLRDLADQSLENAIARHFSHKLNTLTDELRAAAGSHHEGHLITHEPLNGQTQSELKAQLNQLLPGLTWQFTTDAEQTPGIILQVGGARIDWTLDSYMDEFDKMIAQSHVANVTVPSSATNEENTSDDR